MSYNQDHDNSVRLRHLFFPRAISFLIELLVTFGVIFILLIDDLERKFSHKSELSDTGIADYVHQLAMHINDIVFGNDSVGKLSLFCMWAIAGMMIYIVVFKIIQLSSGTFQTMRRGIFYISADHSHGLFRWLGSLHNIFTKFIITILALSLMVALLLSTIIALLINDTNKKPAVAPRAYLPGAQITISANGFEPATLVVKKGTRVVWVNKDAASHQLVANPYPSGDSLPGLKSEILNSDQTYEYTAGTKGTFGYHDQLNPTTNGTIDVKE